MLFLMERTQPMKVFILGREYEFYETTPDKDPVLKNADGYCDKSTAVCVIDARREKELNDLDDMDSHKRKVSRHELIHAFLAESGLVEQCDWACEEMIDWLAYQFPKMMDVFKTVGCLE